MKSSEIKQGKSIKTGRVIEGDNLRAIQSHIGNSTIDLIYLDPPFNTGSRRVGVARKTVEGDASTTTPSYDDAWKWNDAVEALFRSSIETIPDELGELMTVLSKLLGKTSFMAYLAMMLPRLLEFHRILKTTGNIFLHCDPTSSHYLKLMLDVIFGRKQFRNEIIWSYKSGGASSNQFARKHDVILFYSKDVRKKTFNPIKEKSYNRNLKPYRFEGVKEYSDDIGWYTLVNMKDVWQINMVGRTSSERTGYPTQKPEALLERIITAGSDIGDTILDPFCGSGTTLAVAKRLNRRWIGIDSSRQAVRIARERLTKVQIGSD